MGYSYGVPFGAYPLSAGDPRCGGLVAPPDATQRIFVEEPVVSTNTMLIGGAIAAGLIVLAALT